MCSGFEVSAKPCMDEMGVDRGRRVESSVSTKHGKSARGYRHASIGRPSRARRVDVARARLAPNGRVRVSRRRGATRTHREDESPVGHRAPKMRRLRSRGTVDERAKRHVTSSSRGSSRTAAGDDNFFFLFRLVTRRRRDGRTRSMETRGTGRESNGREIARWSDAGDVVVGSARGCVVVEVRARDESVFCPNAKVTCFRRLTTTTTR